MRDEKDDGEAKPISGAATYQNRVEIVGISLWIRRVDGQRHTVGEYRRQN